METVPLQDVSFLNTTMQNTGLYDVETMQITITFCRNATSDDDVKLYITTMERIYAKNKPFVICFDASRLTSISMSHLKSLKKAIQDRAEDATRLIIACATIFPPTKIAELVKKVLPLDKSTYDMRICKSAEEALQYLQTYTHPKLVETKVDVVVT